jgi:hypothetical protein
MCIYKRGFRAISAMIGVIGICHAYGNTYHLRFIPEGVPEASQIFLRDTHVLPKLLSYEEYCRVTGGKQIAL